MKFKVHRADLSLCWKKYKKNFAEPAIVEIVTLEELLSLLKNIEEDVIISVHGCKKEKYDVDLMIYDDYIE